MSQALTKPIRPDVIDALTVLVLNHGEVKKTAEQVGVARKTLHDWRDKNAELYADLCEKHNKALEKRQVGLLGVVTHTATKTVLKAVREADRQLDKQEDKMPAATAQRLMTVAGIATDKSLLYQGRPSQITEQRDAAELVRAIQNMITPEPESSITAEVVEDQGSENDPKTLEGTTEGNE